MFTLAQSFLCKHYRLLVEREFEQVARQFAPFTLVDYADCRVMLRGPDETAVYLRHRMDACNDIGVTAISPKVIATNVQRGSRFKTVVDLICTLKGTQQVFATKADFGFLKIGCGDLQIEMIQYHESSTAAAQSRAEKALLTA